MAPQPSQSPATAAAADSETLRRNRILSSKLYFDVPSSKVPIIYSTAYDIAFLGIEKLHPFDSSKWGRICQFLISAGLLDKKDLVEPVEASKDDLIVVHSEKYLTGLKSSLNVATIIEVPPVAMLPNCLVQQKVLYPFRKQVGGTILAAKLAKERGWAINVGGGFHHCSAEKGGGFCAYADISLCIHFAFVRLGISRVLIIDLDAHQGNGHETDFSNDSRVYVLDMYNPEIYPLDFVASRWISQKVEVPSGTSTMDYLKKLDLALQVVECAFDPDLVVYNAGTDILEGDPLGQLKILPSQLEPICNTSSANSANSASAILSIFVTSVALSMAASNNYPGGHIFFPHYMCFNLNQHVPKGAVVALRLIASYYSTRFAHVCLLKCAC